MTLTFPIRSDKLSMSVSASARLASVRSPFQQIEVYQTEVFGKVLLLDGHVQLAEFDEHAYHESLVAIPLLGLTDPKSALVIGGGDGGVLRELCKHPTLKKIEMVEIDEEVVRISREFLPALSDGAFDDPRVCLHLTDAFDFVKGSTDRYDLIVMDCTDVYEDEEGELSERLFTESFYQDLTKLVSDDGIVVSQADNPVFCPASSHEVEHLLSSAFPNLGTYWALVPSFGGYSAFCWGSRKSKLSRTSLSASEERNYKYLTSVTIDLAFAPLPFS